MQRRKFFVALLTPVLVPFIPISLTYRLKCFQFRHDVTDDQMRRAGLTEQLLNEPPRLMPWKARLTNIEVPDGY